MDAFFNLLRKSIVASVCFAFALTFTYVPQNWNEPHYAHAGGDATEATQIANNVILGAIQAAGQLATSFLNSLNIKELTLDGIAWSVAKAVLSSVVRSTINWINSGFQGSPAFVTDLQGFLLDVADQAVGEYIEGLGGIGSFICSPFRLDVQIAVALEYERIRTNAPAPTCTVTGIIDNIEGFISGQPGSFYQGGWNDWFDLVSRPHETPYGAVIAGRGEGLNAAIVNAKGEQIELLNWANGFMSFETCADAAQQDCWISTPGKVISEALTFNLETGQRTLIEADEINELIGALFSQLAQQALTGAAGVLGLTGGPGARPGSGFSANSYLDQLENNAIEEDETEVSTVAQLQNVLNTQQAVYNFSTSQATFWTNRAEGHRNAGRGTQATNAQNLANGIQAVADQAAVHMAQLQAWINEYPTANTARRSEIVATFTNSTYYTEVDLQRFRGTWPRLAGHPSY